MTWASWDAIRRGRDAHKVWCDTRTPNRPQISVLRGLGSTRIARGTDHGYRKDFTLWERRV